MGKDTDSAKTVIEASPNGPYVVANPPPFGNSKGEELPTRQVTALCRCGGSSNKPFCDGTHTKIGFSGERVSDGATDRQDRYEGSRLTINDNRGVCAHAGVCTDGLKSVFRLGVEPWIDPNGAKAEEIIATVRSCPSGALSYTIDGVEHADQEREPRITVTKDGPYRVEGGPELKDPVTGQRPQSREHYTLCRCGGSKNKPFCDGTHWHIKFSDEKN